MAGSCRRGISGAIGPAELVPAGRDRMVPMLAEDLTDNDDVAQVPGTAGGVFHPGQDATAPKAARSGEGRAEDCEDVAAVDRPGIPSCAAT